MIPATADVFGPSAGGRHRGRSVRLLPQFASASARDLRQAWPGHVDLVAKDADPRTWAPIRSIKKLLGAPGIATRSKKLLVASYAEGVRHSVLTLTCAPTGLSDQLGECDR